MTDGFIISEELLARIRAALAQLERARAPLGPGPAQPWAPSPFPPFTARVTALQGVGSPATSPVTYSFEEVAPTGPGYGNPGLSGASTWVTVPGGRTGTCLAGPEFGDPPTGWAPLIQVGSIIEVHQYVDLAADSKSRGLHCVFYWTFSGGCYPS